MNRISTFLLHRVMHDQSGQALVMMALYMVGFLGLVGFVVDVGDVYYNYQQLQASTNAAALAGALGLTTSGAQALSNAELYSSQVGDKNQYANLNVIKYSAKLGCVTAAVGADAPCVNTGIGTQVANAIQVTQTALVKTYFMAVLGTPSVTLTVTSTGLTQGSTGTPSNIAIIVDATASMNTQDTNCASTTPTSQGGTAYLTRFECAQQGVQNFLSDIYPCATSGCGGSANSNGVYPNSVDSVSLFSFPEPASNTQAANDYTCGAGNPQIVPYTYPSATATSYSPTAGTPTYQITPFMSNYQTENTSGGSSGILNTSSGAYVSLAVGAQSGCGMSAPGGEGTYYAGAIYAAQSALAAQQAAEAANGMTAQNVLIIVSDGAATSKSSQMSTAGLNANGVGIYPSTTNECAQAVAAAQAATAAGTKVYSVAYGSPNTGCTTDTASGGITSPCSTMQQMASQPSTFYSDNNQSGVSSNCYSANAIGDLSSIFKNIASGFTHTRLIPSTAFPSS